MTPRPGDPEIRQHRLPRRRLPLLLAALAGLGATSAALVAAPTAGAQSAPTLSAAPGTPTTTVPTTTSTTLPTPVALTKGPGVYGAPIWLPLRRNLDGEEVKVGCTYDSHGSQFGYECSGHHSRWAIDFIAAADTPVYAAGAGFATNITGKPGGSGFGNVVRIDHGFGQATLYGHLTTALIPPEGAWVDENTQIGTVGSTGSSSTTHLHYERFAIPSAEASGYYDQESVDPGPLFACRGDLLVSFPQVGGYSSWKGVAWGSFTVASDGDACVSQTVQEAPPAAPVVRTDPTGPWSSLIGPVLDLLGHAPQGLRAARP